MQLSKGASYVIISLSLWLIVEFVTVWRARLGEWISAMPWPIAQYLFIILVFWFFLFVKNWGYRKVFIAMLIVMYIFELLWQNALLLNAAWFIPTSILLVQIWGFLVFIPFWIVNRSIRQNRGWVVFYCLWPALGFVMALFI